MFAAVLIAAGRAAPHARASGGRRTATTPAMLEARVREDIERRIVPLLEQMAPGQAELKYVDVRVTRPTALPAGRRARLRGAGARAPSSSPRRRRCRWSLDAKLPPPFRKDLKTLIKNRLDGLAVPVDIKETRDPVPDAAAAAARRRARCRSAIRRCRRPQQPAQPAAPAPAGARRRRRPTPQDPPAARGIADLARDRARRAGRPDSARSRWRSLIVLRRAGATASDRRGDDGAGKDDGAGRRRAHAPRPRRPITCPTCGARCARIACWPGG